MANRNPLFAGAARMSFAHLLDGGRGRRAAAAAAAAEDEPDEKDGQPGADEDDEQSPPKGRKAKGRAEGDEDKDPDAEGDEDETAAEEDEDETSASDDDGDESGEDEEEPPKSRKAKGRAAKPASADFKRGRAAERRRCAAIFKSAAAGRNPALAAHLAFNTGTSSAAAIQILQDTPVSAAHSGRADRNPQVGSHGGRPGGEAAQGAGWDKAFAKVTPGGSKADAGWAGAFDRVAARRG